MLFNTWQFAVFLLIVFPIYWIVPHKYRWGVLLVASYYFYMCWNAKYLLLILFTTVVSYTCALLLEQQDDVKKKKGIVLMAAGICLGVLFVFKYFNFFVDTVNNALRCLGSGTQMHALDLLLPVGISFYTFQTLSYVIDVYRHDIKAEHHFGYYAMYISFFPQLVAGPIERAGNLLPQFKQEQRFSYEEATYGLKMMAWGLFKKMLIADLIARYVDMVFSDVRSYTGFACVIAAVLFSIQIYCDFSGYSDMALGVARLFGIKLMKNFEQPFFACSIKEFWRRWHISLSSWFRDYVYIPLGGNRAGRWKYCRNQMITFLLSGLWHGANWTFIIWGGMHGIFQVIEKIFNLPRKNDKLTKIFGPVIVFPLVILAFIFFRASSLSDAAYVLVHLFDGILAPAAYIRNGYAALGITAVEFATFMAPIILLFVFDFISLKQDAIELVSRQKVVVRWSIYIVFIVWILYDIQYVLGASNMAQKFIYFDF